MKKPVLNYEQMKLESTHVADIYHKLTLDLFDRVVDRLLERGPASLEENPYIWQLEKLHNMGLLNESNLKLIAERSKIAEEKLREVIVGEGYRIYKDTKQQLAEQLDKPVSLGDSQIMERLIALSNQTFREVDNIINTTLPMEVRKVYQSIVEETVAEVAIGTMSADQALNKTVIRWRDKGFYGFTDRSGKRLKADTYARTIIKSTTYRAYNEARTAPAKELGIDTFHYSMKATAREMCAPLQNQIVTTGEARIENGVKILALSDYGHGTPGGCLGINCGHVLTPFLPGINEIPELPDHLKDLTPEQAIKNANAQAKQRALERDIRLNKERLHVAKKLGDKSLIDKYKLRGVALNDAMNQWVRKHPFLYRDKVREAFRKAPETDKKVEKILGERYNKFNEKLQNKITKAQYLDLISHDIKRIEKVTESNAELANRLSLKIEKQQQHIKGSEAFEKRNNGQSYFVKATAEVIHTHMLTNMDMNKLFRRYQFIESGRIKGVHVQKDGTEDKANQIKVHQGKGGLHGVPNKQKEEE
ncbi:TPA: phage minor capsid protein [Streptococcus suis]